MRVLIFRLNCGYNGITTWAVDLGRELKARGIDVHFWFLGGTPERLALFEAIGPTSIGPLAEALVDVQRARYDVVHVTSGDLQSLAVTLPHSGQRVVATNQATVTGVWQPDNCLALTAISHDLASLMEPFTDLAVDRIYTGISVDRFARTRSLNDDRPIIAWIGRAADTVQKDFARFTRIVAALPRDRYRIWVVEATGKSPQDFVGEGYASVEYDRWLRRVAIDDMPAIYHEIAASGGVLLMTSRFEGMGYVVLEAAACGAPTIGPEVVGLREAIVPEIGAKFAATASDAEAAKLVVDWIDANPRSIARCSARSDFVAARFSVSEMTDRYIAVYNRTTPNRQPTRARMPNPLPAGAEYILPTPKAPLLRHRKVWMPISRELSGAARHRLALKALGRALKYDPTLVVQPRAVRSALGIVGRAIVQRAPSLLAGVIRGAESEVDAKLT